MTRTVPEGSTAVDETTPFEVCEKEASVATGGDMIAVYRLLSRGAESELLQANAVNGSNTYGMQEQTQTGYAIGDNGEGASRRWWAKVVRQRRESAGEGMKGDGDRAGSEDSEAQPNVFLNWSTVNLLRLRPSVRGNGCFSFLSAKQVLVTLLALACGETQRLRVLGLPVLRRLWQITQGRLLSPSFLGFWLPKSARLGSSRGRVKYPALGST